MFKMDKLKKKIEKLEKDMKVLLPIITKQEKIEKDLKKQGKKIKVIPHRFGFFSTVIEEINPKKSRADKLKKKFNGS